MKPFHEKLSTGKSVLIVIAVTFLLTACTPATYVTVHLQKPAEFNIGAVKNIAVLDFDLTGEWTFDYEKKPESVMGSLAAAFKKGAGLTEDPPPPPDPRSAFPGERVSDKLIGVLAANEHYNVLERSRFDEIIQEQNLSLSGLVDQEKAVEAGRLLGVEGLIIGSGTYNMKDDGGWYQRTYKDKTYIFYSIDRTVNVEITYRFINVENGQVLGSKTHHQSTHDYVEAASRADAQQEVKEWKSMVDKAVNKTVDESAQEISPHYVNERRKIKPGILPLMKSGLQYAKRGLWEDAKKSWEQVLQETPPTHEDRVPALYDLAIYYEIQGEFDQAEQYFDQCFQLSGNSSYLDDRKRIRKRIKELEVLENQS